MDHEAQVPYRRVSPKLTVLRQIHNAIGFGLGILASTIALVVLQVSTGVLAEYPLARVVFAIPLGLLIGGIVYALIIPRQVAAMGYREQRDDLVLRQGILFRHQVAVPYGRIQYVDIKQGPLQRSFGITQIVITTAGGGTAARFNGLPLAEAERLRDELTHRGYARLAELGES